MAKIDRIFAQLKAEVKAHAARLTPVAAENMLDLLEQAEGCVEDLEASLSDKDDEIARLKNLIEWAEGKSAQRSAEFLCEWARGEDPRVVRKVTDAIGGGACFRPLPDLLTI